MTAELLRLEFRRNRLSALSAALAFLATLPVCRLVSSTTGLEPRLAVEAALTAWMLVGAPLAAVLIGAASGAASASAEAVDAEAPLPLSAERRAAASMAAAFLLTAAFAAFLLAASSLLGVAVERVLSTHEKNWGRSFWFSLEVSPLLAAACLDALAGAWALSRLIGNGVAGGLLALVATTGSLAAVAVSFGLEVEHASWGARCLAPACAIAGAGVLAKAAAGAAAARARERRSGASGLALALALVAAGPALAWVPLLRELPALNGRLRLAEPRPVRWYQSRDERFPRGARAPAAAGEELAFETVRGGVVGAGARGTRVLVPEADSGLGALLYDPYRVYLRRVLRDGRGRLWVERWARPDTELWRVDGGRADLRRIPNEDGGSTSMVGGEAAKHRFFDGRTESLARLDDYFERGDRARWFAGSRAFADEAARAGGAAFPACGGRCLKAGGRTWPLPGRALWSDPVLPDELARGRAYLVPVRTAKGPEVVACLPDGTTVAAWPFRRIPGRTPGYEALPDGTLFAFGPERTLWSLDPDGRPRRPTPLAALRRSLPSGAGEFPDVVRLDAGGAWLVWGGRLSVVDADGRTTRTVPLPDGVGAALAMKDGFAALSKRRAYFIGWDGAARPLLKP